MKVMERMDDEAASSGEMEEEKRWCGQMVGDDSDGRQKIKIEEENIDN